MTLNYIQTCRSTLNLFSQSRKIMPKIASKFCEQLGIEYPIMAGGMHYVSYAELAAAVSNAGGLGVITSLTQPYVTNIYIP